MVFHDEIDLNPKEVKVKQGGGNAGHNGLKSVQAHLGTPDYWRVRIGIGHPGHRDDVSDFVLSDFSKAEQSWVMPLVAFMGDKSGVIISDSPKGYEEKIKQHLEGA